MCNALSTEIKHPFQGIQLTVLNVHTIDALKMIHTKPQHPITVESRNYTPLLCMLALGKTGEGAYRQDSDIYM